MGPDAMILVVLNAEFHVNFFTLLFHPLHFLPLGWYHLHFCGYWYFSWKSWFQLVIHPAQHFTWCTLQIIWISRMTIFSLVVFLSQFWTSQLFHVRFWLLLLDSHTGFTGDRQGGLVFPSLLEFFTVCCDPYSVFSEEVDVFLEFACFLYDPTDVGNLISGSSAFSKSSLNIWKFSVHMLLKLSFENFEHYIASMWDECNCAVVGIFFHIAFLWDWNENSPLVPLCFLPIESEWNIWSCWYFSWLS